MTINLNELPKKAGIVNVYERPFPKQKGDDIELVHMLAVLARDGFGQYAVYVGFSDDPL